MNWNPSHHQGLDKGRTKNHLHLHPFFRSCNRSCRDSSSPDNAAEIPDPLLLLCGQRIVVHVVLGILRETLILYPVASHLPFTS